MNVRLAVIVFLSVVSTFAGAQPIHRDPVPIPVEVVNKLKKEGVWQAVDLGEAAAGKVSSEQGQAFKTLSDPSTSAREKIRKLREEIQKLEKFQSQFESGSHYYRSDVDGRKHPVHLNKAVKAKIDKRIQSLKDQLYRVEQADVGIDAARKNLDPREQNAREKRTQYYDPGKITVDTHPNFMDEGDFSNPKSTGKRAKHPAAPAGKKEHTSLLLKWGAKILYSVLSTTVSSAEAAPPPVSSLTDGCYTGVSDVAAAKAADLDLNVDQIGDHQEFHDLAAQLHYSPVEILQYVANEFDYDLYKGAVLGALGTLKAKRGNDIDHASLLVALLRASNIPARYVSGDILLENRQAHYYWHRTLSFGGMNTANSKNGKIRDLTNVQINGRNAMRTEHVWVEACVPYANYRGTKVSDGGYRWVAMDGSFKRYEPHEGLDVTANFDYNAYLSTRSKQLPLEVYADDVLGEAKTVQSDATLSDIGTTWEKEKINLEYLPDSLPYMVYQYIDWASLSTTSRWSSVPTSWVKYARIQYNGQSYDIPYSDFANGRVTLSFADQPMDDTTDARLSYFSQTNPLSSLKITANNYTQDLADFQAPIDNSFLSNFRSSGQATCAGPALAKPTLKVEGQAANVDLGSQPACIPYASTCSVSKVCIGYVPVYKTFCQYIPPPPGFLGGGFYDCHPAQVVGYRCSGYTKYSVCDTQWSPAANAYTLSVAPYLNGIQVGAKTIYKNKITPLDYYSLQVYTPNQSDEFLKERFDRLNTHLAQVSDPWEDPDETIGEFLHITGRKYIRYLEEGNKLVGQLFNETGELKDAVVLTSLRGKVDFVYDTPYAIMSDQYLVDAHGYTAFGKLKGGAGSDAALSLAGLSASAYESYLWQENADVDAISTVTGLQIAQDQGIAVSTVSNTSELQSFVNVCTQTPDPSTIPDCYTQTMVDDIGGWFDGTAGETITLPQKPVAVPGFTGYVYLGDRTTEKIYAIGPYMGGYSMPSYNDGFYSSGWNYLDTPNTNVDWYDYNLTSNNNYFSSGWDWDFSQTTNNWNASTNFNTIDSFNYSDYGVDYFTPNTAPSILNSAVSTGYSNLMTWAGDPVNMVTGNMYLDETDFKIPARGLPLVFKRSYNSRNNTKDGPLGMGWTDSFNQSLKFVASEGAADVTEIVWTTSDGGEKFIKLDPSITRVDGALNIVASAVKIPDGFYFTISRPQVSGNPLSEIVVTEKDGTTYRFEAVKGDIDEVAKLTAITDANGNRIALSYANGRLSKVTDPDGRTISFSYNADNYLDTVKLDWTGDAYKYTYTNTNLLETVRNPQDQAKNVNTAFYTYYDGSEILNSLNRLKSYADADGNTMTYAYYVNGRVYSHTDTLGNTQTFTYNDFRRESVSTDERGNTFDYIFNPQGEPLQIVEPNGATDKYRYEDSSDKILRTASVDASGLETLYAYDGDGNVTRETLPSGDTIEYFYYTALGKPQLIKNAKGDYSLHLYDANGNLVDDITFKSGYGSTVDPTTLTAGSFDPTPLAAQILSWTFNSYDAHGNLSRSRQVKDFSNRVSGPYVTYDYTDTDNNVEGVHPTRIIYSGDIDGDGTIDAGEGLGAYSYTYDAKGRLLTGFNDQLYPVQYQYDNSGRVTRGTDAAGQLRDYTYDDAGLLKTGLLAKMENGIYTVLDTTSYKYDAVNRLSDKTDSIGAVIHYDYDKAGNIVQATTPDGYTLKYDYDTNNRLVGATDAEGHTVQRTLDELGRLKVLTDPNGNQTTYTYYGATQNGRLKRVTDAEGHWTEFSYDPLGQVIKTTRGRNATTIYETLTSYDALGRVVRVVQSAYNDTVLGSVRPVTVYEYDTLGNKTAVRAGYTANSDGAPGNDVLALQASYTYDDFGRPLTETNALGKVWRYTQYDAHGNLLTRQDPNGNTTVSTYGYGGVLLTQNTTGPNANVSVTYTRNAFNQPLTIASNNVTFTYRYDRAHRLASVTDSRGNKTVAYDYSIGGLLNKICNTDNNTVCDSADITTAYLYDPVGRLTEVRGPDDRAIEFSYDAGGRLRQKAFPNMVEEAYDYYSDNRLKSIDIRDRANHNTAASMDYTYDDAGRTATVDQNLWGATSSASYGYDGMGRLNSATANWYQESLDYDPWGDRRQDTLNDMTNPPLVSIYQHNAQHQITHIYQDTMGGNPLYSFDYDNNGNQTRQTIDNVSPAQQVTYQYDGADRLISVTDPAAGQETYSYDHSRRRIGRTVGGATTNYLMNGPDIIAEYNGDWSTLQAHYTHGPGMDEPLMRLQGATPNYYHADGQGSIVAVTGAVNTQANPPSIPVYNIRFYTAWGVPAPVLSGTSQTYGYAGREEESVGPSYERIYMRNRYYQPWFGRFTQPDPKGFVDGINTYAYVMNNPVNYVDPWGMVATRFTNTWSSTGNYFDAARNFAKADVRSIDDAAYGLIPNWFLDAADPLTPAIDMAEDVHNGHYGTAVFSAVSLLARPVRMLKRELPFVAKGGDDLVDVYRAVKPNELANIQRSGAFNNLPGLEAKYFTTSAEGATSYAKQAVKAFGDSPYTIVKSQVPRRILNQPGMSATVDRGIPAYLIPNKNLPSMIPQILDYSPLP